MAESRRGSGRKASAVLGMLSQEGSHGRLVDPPSEPEALTTDAQASSNTPEAPSSSPQRRVSELRAEPGEWPTEEERDAMSVADLAMLPPPPSSRKRYKSESQTLRVWPHVAEAQRRSWIDARLGGDPLRSSTEHSSLVLAAGLKYIELFGEPGREHTDPKDLLP